MLTTNTADQRPAGNQTASDDRRETSGWLAPRVRRVERRVPAGGSRPAAAWPVAELEHAAQEDAAQPEPARREDAQPEQVTDPVESILLEARRMAETEQPELQIATGSSIDEPDEKETVADYLSGKTLAELQELMRQQQGPV